MFTAPMFFQYRAVFTQWRVLNKKIPNMVHTADPTVIASIMVGGVDTARRGLFLPLIHHLSAQYRLLELMIRFLW